MNWRTNQYPRAQNGLGWGMNLEGQIKDRQFRKEGTLQRAICILIFVLSYHPCCAGNSWEGIYKNNLKSHPNLLVSPINLSERRDATGQFRSITAWLSCREDSQHPDWPLSSALFSCQYRAESAPVVTGQCLCSHKEEPNHWTILPNTS